MNKASIIKTIRWNALTNLRISFLNLWKEKMITNANLKQLNANAYR